MREDRKTYWAGAETKEFLPELFRRIDAYYTHVADLWLLPLWRASHAASYSGWYVAGRINEVGPNGRLQSMEANEYRNLTTHLLNMITAQKAQPQAQAKNMDHASQQQTAIANGLAETLSVEKQLERIRQDVAEKGLYYGEGWGVPLWNRDLGEVYTVEAKPVVGDDGQPVLGDDGQPKMDEKELRVGDIEYHVLNPLDLVRDVTIPTPLGHGWYVSRRYANRWNLAASNPGRADEILAVEPATHRGNMKRPRLLEQQSYRVEDCDQIVVWDFFHEKCPALRGGRVVTALSESLALVDDDLPYRELPHIRWSASDIEGTPFGYALNFDLLALQQGINVGVSALTTRLHAFGLPTVTGSANTRLENLGDGMTCLTYSEGEAKPELLDFAQIPAGLVEYIKMLRDLMSTYSGINAVARGESNGGVTAASALALLEARAIQFAALSQKADVTFMKRLFTTSLHHYQDHALAPVLVRMVGKANKVRVEQYQSSAFSQVDGYSIEMANPLQATAAGRLQLADGMKQAGVPVTPEQYIQVATTGRLDPVTRGPMAELELIESENEGLSRGEEQHALVTDAHDLHIGEHRVVPADTSLRAKARRWEAFTAASAAGMPPQGEPPGEEERTAADVIAKSLAHIQEHMAMKAQIMGPAPVAPPLGVHPPGKPGEASAAMDPAQAQKGPHIQQAKPAKNPVTGMENAHPQASA